MKLTVPLASTAERMTLVPSDGELIYDETLDKLFFGDGVTPGGVMVSDGTGMAVHNNTWHSVDYTPESRTLTAGVGLTGGGDLSANRTIDLDIASAGDLGGIRVGTNLAIDGSGILSAVIPTASAIALGGIMVGARLSIVGGVLSADVQGGGAYVDVTRLTMGAVTTLAVGVDVSDASIEVLYINAAAPRTLMDITGGTDGQIKIIIFEDSNISVRDGIKNFGRFYLNQLPALSDFDADIDDVLIIVNVGGDGAAVDGYWTEISRALCVK